MQKKITPTKIKLLILDVDGVLTDNKIYYDNKGNELKAFNVRDGLGIKSLLKNHIIVAIISGRKSPAVTKRMRELGVKLVYQGQTDKQNAFNKIKKICGLTNNEIAYIGDDLPDLTIMRQVALPIAVADAIASVRKNALYITKANGGAGAVREVCDLLLGH